MFAVKVPVHEQDAFDETLDQAVTDQTPLAPDGTTVALSEDDLRLRDYLIRKAKEIIADAPIVATHLVAEISGHANSGGNVYVPGYGTSVGFTISVGAPDASALTPPPPQEQTPPVASPDALAGTTAPTADTTTVAEPAVTDVPATTTDDETTETEDEGAEQEVAPAAPSDAPAAPSAAPDAVVNPTPAPAATPAPVSDPLAAGTQDAPAPAADPAATPDPPPASAG